MSEDRKEATGWRDGRRATIALASCVLALALLGGGQVAWGGGSELDRAFGGNGKVVTKFPRDQDAEAYAVAVQGDRRVVAAGSLGGVAADGLILTRYLPDGRLDRSFGKRGRVLADLKAGANAARDVAIQPNGRIVTAGFPTLARFMPDGSVDRSFGDRGKVTSLKQSANALALQPDGKILLAGRSSTNAGFALSRFTRNGTPDRSFGDEPETQDPDEGGDEGGLPPVLARAGHAAASNRTGMTTTDFGAHASVGDLALQRDGKIVVVGSVDYPSSDPHTFSSDLAIVRYRPNGTLDPMFSSDGKLVLDYEYEEHASAVAIGRRGRIVISGGPGLIRLQQNGRLDRSFGKEGVGGYAGGDIELLSDGRIAASGWFKGLNFAVWVMHADGRFDRSFGHDGIARTEIFRDGTHYPNDLAVQRNRKLIVAGGAYRPESSATPHFALARFKAP